MPGKAFRIEEEKQCELKAFVGGQQFLTCTLISKLISHDFLCSLSLSLFLIRFCIFVFGSIQIGGVNAADAQFFRTTPRFVLICK